jgi:protein O-GlcNAc transferase
MQSWRWVLVGLVLIGWGMPPVGVVAQSIDELFEQGNAAQEAGRFSEAEGFWNQVLQQEPNNSVAYIGLGNALRDQRKLEEAIAAYRQAIQIDPNFVNAYIGLGNVLGDQGRLAEAIAAYRQAIQIDPNFVLVYNNMGNALRNQGKLEEAIAAYRQAIQLDPTYASAYDNLGIALRDQGKLEEAIYAYRQAIQLDTTYVDDYNSLGNDLRAKGNMEKAIAAYYQAIQLDPNNALAYNSLGIALREKGKLEEAIAAYRQAIQLDPNYANAYYNLGIALRAQRNIEEAIAAYRQAIQLDPNYIYAHINLGVALRDQGNLAAAITTYRYALSLPDAKGASATAHTLAHNNLGYTLQLQGKLTEAIESYQRSLALDPNFSAAQRNLNEAQRLLSLQHTPQPSSSIDDTTFLPTDEPLLPVLRSTARIISTQSDGVSIGTGWVVKRLGDTVWVVTNRHVVSDDQTQRTGIQVEVEFFSNLPDTQRPRYTATIEQITASDEEPDLAVLKISGIPADIYPLKVRPGAISRNTPIRAIGHPYTVDDPWNSSSGEISNYNPNNPIIPIDAYVAQGNSGGPVINQQMEVIAMMVRIRGPKDLATDPNEDTPLPSGSEPATGEVGLAYRIDIIMEKLKTWQVIDIIPQ